MKRPNVLWICTDEQRWDTIHALGNAHIQTPHIDRLVSEGVAFTHAFCQSPICTASRSSFLTGMYPSSVHGCTNGNDRWADSAPLVTKLLADAGYDCGLAGKLHLAGAHGRIEPRGDDGFREFHWSHDPRDLWPEGHAYADWVHAQGQSLSAFNDDPASVPPAMHQTAWCADRAIEFMEQDRGDAPWLMSVNPFDPHPPLDPPQEYLDRYPADRLPGYPVGETDAAHQARFVDVDFGVPAEPLNVATRRQMQAAYYAMITLIDDNVGRMLESLERMGQRQDTIVIFCSDHGDMVGEHGLLHKGSRFYEPLVRVPLVISWPGRYRQGIVSEALVELMDIAPTLLTEADVQAPERTQGQSLAPLLRGDVDSSTHRDFVRSEFYHALSPVNRPDIRGTYATMYRDRRHKLCVYHGLDAGELFDLQQDPGEFDNLWDRPDAQQLRFDLMKRSFDALAFATDIGTRHVTQF
ncbi:MAG: sulfatase-like hydrolase/transferase [Gemmatimonadetes bacterium]|nr:sulfatase-like hydrolase/transferase [Gemmatimonadota bacterium]MBT4609188.1 sulfatase-like hydrolase/transferase [Gemmatimonadota bacterium]MBT5141301.1 sulfatase-like hydrolase/transferase [Gemmatimonadota bacterium]MBT5590382.1 sulfatase-like hydrolase/transferase [Gemmatimonadota bacterium]MBT5964219.1 sulfatase-like hydrolase/transferase [Gemmatimonadota bacterium]